MALRYLHKMEQLEWENEIKLKYRWMLNLIKLLAINLKIKDNNWNSRIS